MLLIENWLNGSKNFIVGRALYARFGADAKLKELFAKGELPFIKDALVKALQAINESGKRTVIKEVYASYEKMPPGKDSILRALHEEWTPLYSRMKLLQYKLGSYGSDNSTETRENCRLLCVEILDLEQQCMVIWAKKDFYEEHGHLPETRTDEIEIPEDALEAGRLLETTKRQVRRYKKECKDNPANAKYAGLLKKYEDQLTTLTNAFKKN